MVMTFIIQDSNQSQRRIGVNEGEHMLEREMYVQDTSTDGLIATHLVADPPCRRTGRIVIHEDRRDLNYCTVAVVYSTSFHY